MTLSITSNFDAGTLSRLDARTLAPSQTIHVGDGPAGIANLCKHQKGNRG